MNKHVRTLFLEKYKHEADKTYFSPGRVNIIGEHTDYNGGLVMPFCIDKGVYAAVNRNDSLCINIYSENFSIHGIIDIHLDDLDFAKMNNYGDYALGIINELSKRNLKLKYGLDILLSSNLPVGGGLSSSAALAILLLRIFNDEFDLKLSKLDMVKIAKAVENNFLNVQCGIMDQFAIMFGKENHAVYLNAFNLDYQLVPLNFKDYNFVLINSNTTRKLAESKYNERQNETQKILKILKEHFQLETLADIEFSQLDDYSKLIKDDILKKRLKHVVSENERVKQAKKALEINNLFKLGSILNEAHQSLKDDYEVSSSILDELVNIAHESGALGARMIGGGFGGSTLNLVLKKDLDAFIAKFKEIYQKRYEKPFIYSLVYAKDGIKQID